MSTALTNINMAISYLMLTIKLIYFHQLSNCLNIARKLYHKMSHASTNMNMAISYLMLSIELIHFHQLSKV